jgi:hypothetical protein
VVGRCVVVYVVLIGVVVLVDNDVVGCVGGWVVVILGVVEWSFSHSSMLGTGGPNNTSHCLTSESKSSQSSLSWS